jgi:hypothetical protein
VPDTKNLAGGDAFSQDAKLELASLVTTNMVSDQYYRSADDGLQRMRELITEVDPLYAAKAAVYARNEDGIRSITHAVAGELAHGVKGEQWTKRFYDAVVRRPDDATEILAYYLSRYGKPVPNSLKKGLGSSLGKFDTYQLAKYRGDGKAVSLVDVVNICRPRPTDRNGAALKALVEGTLRSEGTWETKVSQAGKAEDVEAAKTEAWAELIRERKIGYFALLRNLRNIAEQAPELVPEACALLEDEKLIRNSLVLPFRFLTALRQLSAYPIYAVAISNALDISLANVPDFGKALVAIDGSGSMSGAVAGNMEMSRKLLGSLFGAALFKKNHSDVLVFGDTAGFVSGLNPTDSTLTITEQINRACYGHSTNFHAIFEKAQKAYDNVIIFSDMQAWVDRGFYGSSSPIQSFANYKARTGAKPNVFAFDLAGYGTAQFPAPQVYQLAGFSDKSLALMDDLKTDKLALVHKIEAITF